MKTISVAVLLLVGAGCAVTTHGIKQFEDRGDTLTILARKRVEVPGVAASERDVLCACTRENDAIRCTETPIIFSTAGSESLIPISLHPITSQLMPGDSVVGIVMPTADHTARFTAKAESRCIGVLISRNKKQVLIWASANE